MRGLILLELLALGALPLGAQPVVRDWLTPFKPHPRCVPEIHQASSPDLPAGATRLLLRAYRTYDEAPIRGALFRIAPLGSTDSTATIRLLAKLDSARIALQDGLPSGRYVVQALSIGYQTRTDTITLSPGLVTSAWVFLDTEHSGIRCRPPGFRRPNERACVVEPRSLIDDELQHAEYYAVPKKHGFNGVPRYRMQDVVLVTDEAICLRAALAYDVPESPPRKVIVLRLGNAGYIVHDPFEPMRGGEFTYTEFFDRRFRRLIALTR